MLAHAVVRGVLRAKCGGWTPRGHPCNAGMVGIEETHERGPSTSDLGLEQLVSTSLL